MRKRSKMIALMLGVIAHTSMSVFGGVGENLKVNNDKVTTEVTTDTSQNKGMQYVEAYYENGVGEDDNNALNVESSSYHLVHDLPFGKIKSLKIRQSDYPNEDIFAAQNEGCLVPNIIKDGILYTPIYSKREARAEITKSGKIMWEINIRDITLKSKQGDTLPLKITQSYTFWEDKFYVTTKWLPTEDIKGIEYAELNTYLKQDLFNQYTIGEEDREIPTTGEWTEGKVYDGIVLFDHNEKTHGSFAYEVINKEGTESLHIESQQSNIGGDKRVAIAQRVYDKDKRDGRTQDWKSGHAIYNYTQIYVDGTNSSKAALEDIEAEVAPLSSNLFEVQDSFPHEGSKMLGYDNKIGAYVVEVFVPGYNYYKEYPNYYPSVKLEMKNDQINRKIRLKTQQALIGPGEFVPAVTGGVALLTDENLVPNGIPVQVSKKWDNLDRTKVSTYNHSYATFELEPYQEETMWHRTTFQNWGDKVNVGLPSLDLSNYYDWGYTWYQKHIGMSEVACYLLDPSVNASLCDFRAINGIRRGDESNPWFENAGGFEFLQLYKDNKWIDAKRRGPGIRFNSIGPNLSQFETILRTSDGEPNIEVGVEAFLIPSNNGTRVFYKLNYNFKEDITLNEVEKELSLFSIGDQRFSAPAYYKMDYLNNESEVITTSIDHSQGWNVSGATLSKEKPWAAFYSEDSSDHGVGFIVHEFEGNFEAGPVDGLEISMHATNNKQTAYLVPNLTSNTIKAGDSAEILVEAYTWKGNNTEVMKEEAQVWPIKLEVIEGTKLDAFPARIKAINNKAEFIVSGGVDYIPVIVEGFQNYNAPLLEVYKDNDWIKVDQSKEINDFWQTTLNEETGEYSFTYALPATEEALKYRICLQEVNQVQVPKGLPRTASQAAFIEEFIVEERIQEPVIYLDSQLDDTAKNTIDIKVSEQLDITTITPQIKVSEGATITPASGETVDFSKPVQYTVRAEDGFVRKYTVTLDQNIPVITKFSLPDQFKKADIDAESKRVTGYVYEDTDVTGIKPTVIVSEGAKIIEPDLQKPIDFTQPVVFKIISKEGIEYSWVVELKKQGGEKYTNVAREKIYYSNPTDTWGDFYSEEKAFDGDNNSFWAPIATNNQELTVDLQQVYSINRINIVEGNELRWLDDYVIQYKKELEWIDIPESRITTGAKPEGEYNEIEISFDPISTDQIRLVINQAQGGIYLREFEIYGVYPNDAEQSQVGIGELVNDIDKWKSVSGNGIMEKDQEGITFKDSKGHFYYQEDMYQDVVFDMNFEYNFIGNDWPCIMIKSQTPDKTIFGGDTAYILCIKDEVYEVQKWVNGKREMLVGELTGFETRWPEVDNKHEKFVGNTSLDIQFGTISKNGEIRIYLKIDNEVILDEVDDDNPIEGEGSFGIYTMSGPVRLAGEYIEVKDMVIKGEESVSEGKNLVLTVGLGEVQERIYAQDFIVKYDHELFDFIAIKGINKSDGEQELDKNHALYQIEQDGVIRVLVATEEGLSTVEDSITLELRAKNKATKQPIETTIDIEKVKFGIINEQNSEAIEALGVSKKIQVMRGEQEIDKTSLRNAIREAQLLSENASIGNAPGEYPQIAKDKLDIAIRTAQQVEQTSEDQKEIDSAVSLLIEAINDFKNSKIKDKDPDVNEDGVVDVADLALIAYYYRATSQSDNWNEAKKVDFNNDNLIDIEDLIIVANKIFMPQGEK